MGGMEKEKTDDQRERKNFRMRLTGSSIGFRGELPGFTAGDKSMAEKMGEKRGKARAMGEKFTPKILAGPNRDRAPPETWT